MVRTVGPHKYRGFRLQDSDKPLIQKLDPHHRAVIEFSGTDKAGAAHLSLPIGTFKSRKHRARAALEAARLQGEPKRGMDGVHGR